MCLGSRWNALNVRNIEVGKIRELAKFIHWLQFEMQANEIACISNFSKEVVNFMNVYFFKHFALFMDWCLNFFLLVVLK